MSDKKQAKVEVAPVSTKELIELRDGLSARYGSRLRPGETLTVDAERDAEHCWARVEVAAGDEFQLELECAAVPGDTTETKWDAPAVLEDVLDMLDAQLQNYFEEDRMPRFHDDWRVYDFEGTAVRFRGLESRPQLDSLADEWLAEGDAEQGEPN